MKRQAAARAKGYALMGAAMLAYFSRPWSCWYVLGQFRPWDAVPYSHFDYHGMGVMLAWVSALVFVAPMVGLAAKVFLKEGTKFGLFGRAPDAKTNVLSILVALALGAPMYSQLGYLIGLPISLTAPVILSSIAWLLVVEAGRTAAVQRGVFDKPFVGIAIAIALLVTIPKLALIGYAVTAS